MSLKKSDTHQQSPVIFETEGSEPGVYLLTQVSDLAISLRKLSYDAVHELAERKHLERLSAPVLEECEESALA